MECLLYYPHKFNQSNSCVGPRRHITLHRFKDQEAAEHHGEPCFSAFIWVLQLLSVTEFLLSWKGRWMFISVLSTTRFCALLTPAAEVRFLMILSGSPSKFLFLPDAPIRICVQILQLAALLYFGWAEQWISILVCFSVLQTQDLTDYTVLQ